MQEESSVESRKKLREKRKSFKFLLIIKILGLHRKILISPKVEVGDQLNLLSLKNLIGRKKMTLQDLDWSW